VSVISIVKVNPLGITIAGTIIFQVYGVQICNYSQKISRYDHVHIKAMLLFDLVPTLVLHTMESNFGSLASGSVPSKV